MKRYASLDHADAMVAIEAIRAELERRGKAAVVAVADDHGELLSLLRVGAAPLPSITIATNKAWTAARERKQTRDIGQASRDPQSGFDIAYYGDPKMVGWGGGVPVLADGEVVGAIAVSGLSSEEDAELASLGAAQIAGAGRAS